MDCALGGFTENKDKIVKFSTEAVAEGCQLVVFPEAALCGYPASDMLEWPEFVKLQMAAFSKLQREIPSGITVVFGLYLPNDDKHGRQYLNSVAVVRKGKKPQFVHKALLPVGDIFDEGRYLQAYQKKQNRIVQGLPYRAVITICEEIWAWSTPDKRNLHVSNPLRTREYGKVDFVINLSSSPFYLGKIRERRFMAGETAKWFKAPLFYTNRVGAQDEFIYDGRSFVVSEKGKVLSEVPAFREGISVFEFDPKKGVRAVSDGKKHIAPITKDASEKQAWDLLHAALVEGIRAFHRRNGFKKIHFGLSGGIDSAVIACLAADAVGPENVTAIAMPTKFNKPESLELARRLAKNLGIEFIDLPIEGIFQNIKEEVDRGFGIERFGLVHENLQARIRGTLLMAYSNHQGSLLLATSNKSESSVGYATLYGDMCGGLAPIADLTKNQVYGLANNVNKLGEVIPKYIIERAPSAELRDNQKDQDSLPPYDQLDELVNKAVVHPEKLRETELDRWMVKKLVASEFKRWQAPPILKISERSFGIGRRWPITVSPELLK